MKINSTIIFFATCLLSFTSCNQKDIKQQLIQLDPLDKVMPDQNYFVEDTAYKAQVAKGEYASFQLLFRSVSGNVKNLTVKANALTQNGNRIEPNLTAFVGYVKASRNTPNPSRDQLRSVQGYYPDPLIETESIDVNSYTNQAIWINYKIPADIAPGDYQAEIVVRGSIDNKAFEINKTVSAKVYDVQLPEQTLWVTNWFSLDESRLRLMNNNEPVEAYSDKFWEYTRMFANKMRDYGQNVYMISPIRHCKVKQDGSTYNFDFSNFDRIVDIFMAEGDMKRIEGGHLGSRLSSDWFSPIGVYLPNGEGKSRLVPFENDSVKNFLKQFVPALQAHLEKKGWSQMYMQHIADEPIKENAGSYINITKYVKSLAPDMKIIEATHEKALNNVVDIWVPRLDSYHLDYPFYKERERAGDEIWYYTCVEPQKNYANRFLEQPLLQTRILHWLNFKYNATGYLHWGLNFWNKTPYDETTFIYAETGNILPGGDSWIVYPAKDKLYGSIRFESMRDGIHDFELLKLLEKKNADAARRIVNSIVYDFNVYENSTTIFRQKKEEILTLLSEK